MAQSLSNTTHSSRSCTIVSIGGQSACENEGHLASSLEEQVSVTVNQLKAQLDSIGAQPRDIIKITHYVVDYDHRKRRWLQHYIDLFGGQPPTTIVVPGTTRLLWSCHFHAYLSSCSSTPGMASMALRCRCPCNHSGA